MKAKKIIVCWMDADGNLSVDPIIIETKLTEEELQAIINEMYIEYEDFMYDDIWKVLEKLGFVKILPRDFEVYYLYDLKEVNK